jgi:hypothetical protein
VTLTLPEPKAVLDLLTMFLGDRPPLRPGGGPDLRQPSFGTYVTWLKTADGGIEGAILTDLSASLYLGGGLIMMPEPALRDMQREGAVSEAVLDGLSEIFNNVRGQLNRLNMNPHVTPTDPVSYEPPADGTPESWIYDACKRIDLRGETAFGPATMTIVGR